MEEKKKPTIFPFFRFGKSENYRVFPFFRLWITWKIGKFLDFFLSSDSEEKEKTPSFSFPIRKKTTLLRNGVFRFRRQGEKIVGGVNPPDILFPFLD